MMTALPVPPSSLLRLLPSVVAMAIVVVVSNILVQYPFQPLGLGEVLTWGAFSYPFAFLVTDLTNRWFGPGRTRAVIAVGFVIGVALSWFLAEPRIAAASGTAFLVGQLLDVSVFNRLRQGRWWAAPAASSTLGSVVDTALFFSIAFAGTEVPWATLAVGDFCVKMLMAALSLIPYASLMNAVRPYRARSA